MFRGNSYLYNLGLKIMIQSLVTIFVNLPKVYGQPQTLLLYKLYNKIMESRNIKIKVISVTIGNDLK